MAQLAHKSTIKYHTQNYNTSVAFKDLYIALRKETIQVTRIKGKNMILEAAIMFANKVVKSGENHIEARNH